MGNEAPPFKEIKDEGMIEEQPNHENQAANGSPHEGNNDEE